MIIPSPIEKLPSKIYNEYGVELWIKRDDLIHGTISGNKYRKLKYNLDKIRSLGIKHVITFGGAHSNHIAAIAFVCKEKNLKCIGIIRGEESETPSPTLLEAKANGMEFIFVSRSAYKTRNDLEYLSDLQKEYPDAYIIPEGGANELGIEGCEDIVTECQREIDFDYITVDSGTGATLAGMVRQLQPHQRAIGVQVLKGVDFISKEVESFSPGLTNKFEVWIDYHFGGYAKYQPQLIEFMRWFHDNTGIKLDPVYTGKQFYAIFDQLNKGYFPESSKIVLTHTGGLQGIQGFEERYGLKIY